MIRKPLPFLLLFFLITPLYASLHNGSDSPSPPPPPLNNLNDLPINEPKTLPNKTLPKEKKLKEAFDAVKEGDFSTLKELIEVEKIDINAEYREPPKDNFEALPKRFETLLEFAIKNYRIEEARYLLTRKKIDMTKRYYIHMLCKKKTNSKKPSLLQLFEELLAKGGGDINSKDKSDCTLLHYVCGSGNQEIFDFLLNEKEIKLNELSGTYGLTPLLNACRNGYPDFVKKLLARKDVDANKQSKENYLPLAETFLYYGLQFHDIERTKKVMDEINTKEWEELKASNKFQGVEEWEEWKEQQNKICLENLDYFKDKILEYEKIIELFLAEDEKYKYQLADSLISAFQMRKYCNKKTEADHYWRRFLKKQPTIINILTGQVPTRTLLHVVIGEDDGEDIAIELLNKPETNPNVIGESMLTSYLGYTFLEAAIRANKPKLRVVEALLTHKKANLPLLLTTSDSNGYGPVFTAYHRMTLYDTDNEINKLRKAELESIVKYLLKQKFTDISSQYLAVKGKGVVMFSKDPYLKRTLEAIKKKYLKERKIKTKQYYNLLCTGYVRSLCSKPIGLCPILFSLLPFVETPFVDFVKEYDSDEEYILKHI